MADTKVNLLASAITRRLAAGTAAASPGTVRLVNAVASVVASRLKRPGAASPAAARLASVAATRLMSATAARTRPRAASPAAARVASAASAARRDVLSAGPVYRPLNIPQLASAVSRRVASGAPETRLAAAVDVGSVDADKVASAVVRRLQGLQEKQIDPSEVVASAIVRRLAAAQVLGSPAAARRFQTRVASAVTRNLRIKKAEPEGKDTAKKSGGGDAPSAKR